MSQAWMCYYVAYINLFVWKESTLHQLYFMLVVLNMVCIWGEWYGGVAWEFFMGFT